MADKVEVKPNKTAFVFYPFLISILIWAFILGIVSVVVFFIFKLNPVLNFSLFFIFFILIALLIYWSLSVQYSKEKYTFFHDKIVRNSGGILSENETELIIRNITHVNLKLPWIENSLFGIGHILVDSAGSSAIEINLRSVDQPEKIYHYVEKIMKTNGFKLTQSKLIEKEKPSSLGVFFEVAQGFFGSIFGLVMFVLYAGGSTIAYLQDYIIPVMIVIFMGLLLLFMRSIFMWLDLERRVYSIYEDTITYSEGFLNKNYSFIPIENLSDSNLTQTLIDKIFGLYDVKVSCPGSGQEIIFKNMVNGPTMEKNLDNLISKSVSLIGKKAEKSIKHNTKADTQPTGPTVDTSFTASLKMDTTRSLFPLLVALPFSLVLFIFLPIWIIGLIGVLIRVNSTKYEIKNRSVEERFSFLNTKNTEFSNEKIMGVIIKENFVDKWFNTCSIVFWSIGSSSNIVFRNIKKESDLQKNLLLKFGVSDQEQIKEMKSEFSILEMIKYNIVAMILLCAVGAAALLTSFITPLLLLVPVVLIAYGLIFTIYKYLYYKKSHMKFFKEYVYFQRGLIFMEYYYSLYNNIKDIRTLRYPLSDHGNITFNVAGEHMETQGKNQILMSNKFTIEYVSGIRSKDELIDMIFYSRPDASQVSHIEENINQYMQKPVLTARPAVANLLSAATLICIVIFPLLVIYPFIAVYIIWKQKVTSYHIESYRVLQKSGIIYRSQLSILFKKIDHINSNQGMFNKLFRNGNIIINTAGSSLAELVASDLPNYQQFYETLKEKY
ncbi:PH domain-containing protein [Candidatus Woesearchaeota archaeon]|nr:PH domain-containing protein [Candidatus Woesearchaeota archaeon]